jgi:hypothetical protein
MAATGLCPNDERHSDEEPIEEGGALPEEIESRPLHELVHVWIPLAIVVASVLAAIVGWRASVAEEHATHHEELARQDLVQQQQQLVSDQNAVATDLRTFGQFAEFSTLGHALLGDAGKVTGAVSDELRTQGESDLGVARYLGQQVRWLDSAYDRSSPGTNPNLRADGSYQPGHPYNTGIALDAAENGDPALHGLSPAELHAQAETLRSQAVHLTGIAAIFVGVLMLLTLAAVVPGPPKVLFAGSSAVLGTVGLVLFLVVVV